MLAFFFDMAILHFLVVFTTLIYGVVTGTIKDGVNEYILLIKDVGKERLYYDIRYFEFVLVIIYAVYSFIMEFAFRGSLGKMAMRIKVSSDNRFFSALVRSVVKIGVVYLWPIALLLSKCNSKRRWIQDYIGNAQIVYK